MPCGFFDPTPEQQNGHTGKWFDDERKMFTKIV
jgi:hypothetical protein